MSTHNICFYGEIANYQIFLLKTFPYLELWKAGKFLWIQGSLFLFSKARMPWSNRKNLLHRLDFFLIFVLLLSSLSFWSLLCHSWMDMSTNLSGSFSLKSKTEWQCISWWGCSLRAVSSGSALFAKVSVLVCRDERVKQFSELLLWS